MSVAELPMINSCPESQLVVLSSGNGTHLQTLHYAIQSGVLQNTQISLVVADGKDAQSFVHEVGLPAKVISEKDTWELELRELIMDISPSLIVLDGWNQPLTNRFLSLPFEVINMHPASTHFVGNNAVEQTWTAYQKSLIDRTEITTHEVGYPKFVKKVLASRSIPIYDTDTLDTLIYRIQYHERSLLVQVVATELDINRNFYRGKVRDIISLGYDVLILQHSNRLSSFDRHICDIEWKGHVLNKTSVWWFNKTRHIVANHLLYHDGHIMMVRKCTPFKIEFVVRGYITGNTKTSLWTHYEKNEREYCGVTFPDGLVKNQKLPENVLTPTTKGVVDIPISPSEIVSQGYMTAEEWNYVSQVALQLFAYGQSVAEKRGFILVDTKYEFGKDSDGVIRLIDEIHTCDSSRYWMKNTYNKRFKVGKSPDKIDKDIIRDYVRSKCDPYNDPIPKIPKRMKNKVKNSYIKFYERLTNQPNDHTTWENPSIMDVYSHYFKYELNDVVVILSGSKTDAPFVNRMKSLFKENNIYATDYVLSAHRSTGKLLDLLNYYENPVTEESPQNVNIRKRIVYVTVAGRSNALSGVVACNTSYPVIACPPFKDKSDMLVNVQSSLQMPRNVPVMTILEPLNVVHAIKRMFAL